MSQKIVIRACYLILFLPVLLALASCQKPKEDIVLRSIKDVVIDATTEPMLKANAIFFNPNKMKGKLKKIDVEIFINGKRAASVKQDFNTVIPANAEFTIPLLVKLSMKEISFQETLLSMVGGRKFEVKYVGTVRISYKGVPFTVPVDYKDNIRLRF